MPTSQTGPLRKLTAQLDNHGNVNYQLPIGEQHISLNELIGKHITLEHVGVINCSHCGRKTKKSYSQGFCYPCMKKLARCDMCIMKPETCHFHLGTCREPEWGINNCMVPHYVYLANSSGLKVGITRHTQLPTRWIDQGAIQALPIFKVASRIQSGLIETALTEFVADKTNWRVMLKGKPEKIDLVAQAKVLKPKISQKLADIVLQYGECAIESLVSDIVEINFPVQQYLDKINSFNFDKTPLVSGKLLGIKGQYLIFDAGVINMRKFTSYHINIQWD